MDCHMPKLDGYATTRRLRELEAISGQMRTPVIALTANAQGDDARPMPGGRNGRYLSKPFSVDELYVILKPYAQQVGAGSRTPAQSGATLDEQALRQIRSLRKPGGPDLLKRIADLYITNSRTLIDSLHESVNRNDAGRRAAGRAHP